MTFDIGSVAILIGVVIANGLTIAAIWVRLTARITILETENKVHKEFKIALEKVQKTIGEVHTDVALIKQKLYAVEGGDG